MLFKYIYILCALITSSGIYAQFTVKGTVLFEGGDKAASATLHLLQSRTVATTGVDGAFTLQSHVSPDTLVIVYMGFESNTLVVTL